MSASVTVAPCGRRSRWKSSYRLGANAGAEFPGVRNAGAPASPVTAERPAARALQQRQFGTLRHGPTDAVKTLLLTARPGWDLPGGPLMPFRPRVVHTQEIQDRPPGYAGPNLSPAGM